MKGTGETRVHSRERDVGDSIPDERHHPIPGRTIPFVPLDDVSIRGFHGCLNRLVGLASLVVANRLHRRKFDGNRDRSEATGGYAALDPS